MSECTRPSGASPRYLYQTKFSVEATALRRAGIEHKEFDVTREDNERTRKSKKCTVRSSSQRPRMSEDEGINFDTSASRYEYPG